MDNNDVKILVETFNSYRELLDPIQQSLVDFIDTYNLMRDNIDKLNDAFGGGVKQKLEFIYSSLSSQTEKAADLASRIDQFVNASNQYTSGLSKLIGHFAKIEERLKAITELDNKVEGQIGRLDVILEEKGKSYNIKELQKTLDGYNSNVVRVADFINKDVASSLEQSRERINGLCGSFDELIKKQRGDSANLESILEGQKSSNALLKKLTEQGDVNQAYIFDILDRWADDRRVKTKKKD